VPGGLAAQAQSAAAANAWAWRAEDKATLGDVLAVRVTAGRFRFVPLILSYE
jgi:hypothetical protein